MPHTGLLSFLQPVLKGSLAIGSVTDAHAAFHTLVLSVENDQTGVSVTALEDETELILVCTYLTVSIGGQIDWSFLRKVAGEPLDQTVFQYGPFVMTTREEIQKTLLDCQWIAYKPTLSS